MPKNLRIKPRSFILNLIAKVSCKAEKAKTGRWGQVVGAGREKMQGDRMKEREQQGGGGSRDGKSDGGGARMGGNIIRG